MVRKGIDQATTQEPRPNIDRETRPGYAMVMFGFRPLAITNVNWVDAVESGQPLEPGTYDTIHNIWGFIRTSGGFHTDGYLPPRGYRSR